MRRACVVPALAILLSAMPATVTVQETGLAADFRADWTGQHAQIMGIAGTMPADRCDYKATNAQRTDAEQGLHLVQIGQLLFTSLGSPVEAPDINLNVTAKADVLRALDQCYAAGTEVLEGLDDTAMPDSVDGPRLLGRSIWARVVACTLAHTMDIYGQLAVELRPA